MEASKALTIPVNTELQGEADGLVAQAKAVVIKTQEDYAKAGELRAAAKDLDKKADAFYKPLKQSVDQYKREHILDPEKATRGPLAMVAQLVNPKLIAWEDEQERKRLAEQRRLQAIADKQANKETKVEAKALEKEGRHEEATIVRETPVETTVVVRSETPKVADIGSCQPQLAFQLSCPIANRGDLYREIFR